MEYAGIPDLNLEGILAEATKEGDKLHQWITDQLRLNDEFAITQQKFCHLFNTDFEAEEYLNLYLQISEKRDYFFTISPYSLAGKPELVFKRNK